eukprot:jgi/Botrbrau1/2714/Bobra.0203s0056.1
MLLQTSDPAKHAQLLTMLPLQTGLNFDGAGEPLNACHNKENVEEISSQILGSPAATTSFHQLLHRCQQAKFAMQVGESHEAQCTGTVKPPVRDSTAAQAAGHPSHGTLKAPTQKKRGRPRLPEEEKTRRILAKARRAEERARLHYQLSLLRERKRPQKAKAQHGNKASKAKEKPLLPPSGASSNMLVDDAYEDVPFSPQDHSFPQMPGTTSEDPKDNAAVSGNPKAPNTLATVSAAGLGAIDQCFNTWLLTALHNREEESGKDAAREGLQHPAIPVPTDKPLSLISSPSSSSNMDHSENTPALLGSEPSTSLSQLLEMFGGLTSDDQRFWSLESGQLPRSQKGFAAQGDGLSRELQTTSDMKATCAEGEELHDEELPIPCNSRPKSPVTQPGQGTNSSWTTLVSNDLLQGAAVLDGNAVSMHQDGQSGSNPEGLMQGDRTYGWHLAAGAQLSHQSVPRKSTPASPQVGLSGAHGDPGSPRAKMRNIVVHAGTVYISGQVSEKLEGVSGTSYAGQLLFILEKVERLLFNAASDKFHLIKVQVFLREMSRGYSSFKAIWNHWLEDCVPPALTVTESRHMDPKVLIQLDVTASLLS